jgi:hypothetical protein
MGGREHAQITAIVEERLTVAGYVVVTRSEEELPRSSALRRL